MSRFASPSVYLELRSLLNKAQRAIWGATALAVGLHFALSRVVAGREEVPAVKPLTTQFIKRAPRLSKPLELKKRPQPKRRSLHRKMVSVKAKAGRTERTSPFEPGQVIGSLSGPRIQVERTHGFAGAELEPEAVAGAIEGTMEPKEKLAMGVELIDVEALDTGRYHAMVIQDPNDKQNIRGFLHIAVVYPTSITKQSMEWINKYVVPGLANLAGAMNQYTGIKADVRGRFPFNSRQMFSTPWVYVRYGIHRGATTDGELKTLGEYALSGGFVHVDGHGAMWQQTWAEWIIVTSLKFNGLERGRHWEFDHTGSDHPLFHCFFDFEEPPTGGHGEHYLCSAGYVVPQVPYFDTVSIDGRMIIMYCPKWYGLAWSDWPGTLKLGANTRQLQFGVNLLVFALTQEGGITNRVMDTVAGQ